MEFPSINIEIRDDSPVPENGGHLSQHHAGAPSRRATTTKLASTPRASSIANRIAQRSNAVGTSSAQLASTPRASDIADGILRGSNTAGPSNAQEKRVTFDKDMDLDSLSSLTDYKIDELEETGRSEAENEVTGSEGVSEGLIAKPKGEARRPGHGGLEPENI